MTKTLNFIGLILGLVGLIVIGLLVFGGGNKTGTFGTAIVGNVVSTNTSSTASSTASLMVASFSGTQKRVFTNIGSNTIYLSEKSTSTGFTAQSGLAITAGSQYQETLGLGNLWGGNVYGITVSGTSSLSIQQF